MAKKSHTHVLAKPHVMVQGNGIRKMMPTGTPCSPTERQVLNMPDVFLRADGGEDREESREHGMKFHSVGHIKDLAEETEDVDTLKAMLSEEETGRDRKSVVQALKKRIKELKA